MGFNIKVNWDDDAIRQVADQGLQQAQALLQEACDSVHTSHAGRPVEEVRGALRKALTARDLNPDAADEFAAAIAAGQRVVVKTR